MNIVILYSFLSYETISTPKLKKMFIEEVVRSERWSFYPQSHSASILVSLDRSYGD